MTDQEKNAKFEELTHNAEFARKFEAVESPEAIIALFAEEGVEVSPEYAQNAYDILQSPDEFNGELDGELSDEMLDDVAGGFSITLTVGACCAVYAAIYGTAYGYYKMYTKNNKK